jgi:hypothetical protein
MLIVGVGEPALTLLKLLAGLDLLNSFLLGPPRFLLRIGLCRAASSG